MRVVPTTPPTTSFAATASVAATINENSTEYADDFVVLCRKNIEETQKVVRHVRDRLGLNLNEVKTHKRQSPRAF